MQTAYEQEFQRLKPDDEIQSTEMCPISGYPFISTAGHGYLAVPLNDEKAKAILKRMDIRYGFKGRLAYYLEEDCEAPEFIKLLKE